MRKESWIENSEKNYIAMIEKVNANKIQDFLEKSSSRQPNSTAALPDNDVDASIQVDYASLIDGAMQIPESVQALDWTIHGRPCDFRLFVLRFLYTVGYYVFCSSFDIYHTFQLA